MKKFAILFSMFVLLVGCEKSDDLNHIDTNNNDIENSGALSSELPEVLHASIESDQTRAFVGDDNVSVLWHNGDAISFFSGISQNVKYVNSSEAGATATFKMEEGTGSEAESSFPYAHAIYPYSTEYTSSTHSGAATIQTVSVNYPATQTYAEGSFGRGANLMFGRVESGENPTNYTFRHVNGFLVLKLYGEGVKVKEIKLTALGNVKIAGAAEINSFASASAISANMQETATSTVTLDCSNGGAGVALGATAETATEFWFALPEVEMTSGMKIQVTSTDDVLFEKQTTNSVTIERAKVQPMAALKFEASSPYQLLYTTTDDTRIDFGALEHNPFNASISSNTYKNGQGVIVFNDQLTTIGAKAFRSSKLEEITIPGSVVEIATEAFISCYNLKSITFLPSPSKTPLEIAYYQYQLVEVGPFTQSPLIYINMNRQLKYVAPDGIDYTADGDLDGIFYYNSDQHREELTVILGEQVTSILTCMFIGAPIKNITIPATVTEIQTDAFHGCEKLESLTFESGTVPLKIWPTTESLKNYGPFYDSKTLSTLYLDRELEPQYDISLDRHGLFSKDEPTSLTSVTLGSNVKTISNRMFLGTGITEITIPSSVNTISVAAFNNCEALSSITFQGSSTAEILNIGQGLNSSNNDLAPFYYSPLASVNIDRNLLYVDEKGATFTPDANDEYLFTTDSDALTTVTIGGNATNIFNNMFNECPNITSVTFEAGTSTLNLGYDTEFDDSDYGVGRGPFLNSPNINTVVLNRNINYSFGGEVDANTYNSVIRASIFNNNHTLTNITIGEGVTLLPDYAFAGAGLSGKEIRLHEGLQTIGKYAFYDAQINGGIYIPASVTTIKDRAFRKNNDSKITCLGTTPATIEGIPFYGNFMYKISVPAESVDAYKEAWTTYSNQIQAITE